MQVHAGLERNVRVYWSLRTRRSRGDGARTKVAILDADCTNLELERGKGSKIDVQ